MENPSTLERVASMSDVASVNSDESLGPSHGHTHSHAIITPGSSISNVGGKHMSKSPSIEVKSLSNSNIVTSTK